MKKPIAAFLSLMILSALIIGTVFAWDPAMSDLTGTNSSMDRSVSLGSRRFDIDSTVNGMQKGDDTDSIAHLMKMVKVTASTVGPSTAATISTTDPFATQDPPQRKCFYANGRYWVFYCNGSSPAYIAYRTSTDGSAWSSNPWGRQMAAGSGGAAFSIWFDGTYVHYAYCSGGPIYYRRGTPNSGGSITWSQTEQTVSTTGNYANEPFVSTDSNGYVFIGYRDEVGGSKYPYVIKSQNNDGTWGTTPSPFPYQLSTTNTPGWRVSVIPLTGGKMFAVYCNDLQTAGINGRRWTGSEWGSERTTTRITEYTYSAVAQGDDVHLVFNRYSPHEITYTKYTYTSDSWGTETNIQTLDTWAKAPVLSINTANNDLYCFWSGYPTYYHIYYKKYSGGSWDASPTDWITESSLTDDNYLTCFYQSYRGRIGLEYQTATSQPFSVRFASLTIQGFQVPGMTTNDQYDINFTIGAKDFCMLFIATGSNSGTLKLFYKDTGAGSWTSGETHTQSNIASGTSYQSGSGNIGFNLASSSSAADGSIKFIVKRSYLTSLGASGDQVTNVVSATYEVGTGQPDPSSSITVDAVSTGTGTGSSITVSHTTSGINERGNAKNGGTTGTSASITHGLTIYAGDVVIAMIHANLVSNTITDNNGAYSFTQAIQEVSAESSVYAIFYRVAGSSEPATYQWTIQSASWSVLLRVFSGVDTSYIWDVPPSTSTRNYATSGTTGTAPSMTTSSDGAMGICFFISDSTNTWSNPTNGYGTEVEQTGTISAASYIRRWATAGSTGTTSATLSASNDWLAHQFALKPGLTSRLMLVGISGRRTGGGLAISSVTYNGVALSLVGVQLDEWNMGFVGSYIYALVAPDTGTHDVVVTFSGAPDLGGVVGVVTFSGVAQGTPLGTFAGAYGAGTNASVTVSSASGELVFDTVTYWDTSMTVGGGQTQRWKAGTGDCGGGGSTEPGAATVAMSWTLTYSDSWVIGAVPIKPTNPNDRCPSTGTASWSCPPVPEFPLGILVLGIPVVGIYLYMRKRSRMDVPTHVRGRF